MNFINEESARQKKNLISEKFKIIFFNIKKIPLGNSIMKQTKLGSSLSGIDIPLLTITDYESKDMLIENRKVILFTGMKLNMKTLMFYS